MDSFYLAGRAASGIGGSFLQTGDSDSAVDACLYAIELFTKSGDLSGRAVAYNNIGIAFNRMSQG